MLVDTILYGGTQLLCLVDERSNYDLILPELLKLRWSVKYEAKLALIFQAGNSLPVEHPNTAATTVKYDSKCEPKNQRFIVSSQILFDVILDTDFQFKTGILTDAKS